MPTMKDVKTEVIFGNGKRTLSPSFFSLNELYNLQKQTKKNVCTANPLIFPIFL